jgi:hypothetical protein
MEEKMKPRHIIYLVFFIVLFNSGTAESNHALNKNLGVVVGANVRARSGPGTYSSIITTFNTGYLVKKLGKTEKPVRLLKSREFHYHWYRIEYKPGKTAWIYGQFLYQYSARSDKFNAIFSFKGRKYRVLEFNEEAIEYDAPGQNQFTFPCIYSLNEGKVYPLYINPAIYKKIEFRLDFCEHESDPYVCYKKKLFLFIGNMGGAEGIEKKLYIRSSTIIIPVFMSLQDGGSAYDMKVIFSKGMFRIIDIMNYRRLQH